MKNLFLFLLLAFISTYLLNPPTVTRRILYVVGIPICGLIAYGFVSYFFFSSFTSGKEIAMSIIPSIISAIVINYQLKKKSETDGKVKFPIVLFIFLLLSLILAIVQFSIESSNRKAVKQYMKDKYYLNMESKQKNEYINGTKIYIAPYSKI